MRCFKVTAALLALSSLCYPSHKRNQRAHAGQAGVFDFYLLVLSWSPEFCHSKPTAAQCSAHTGFIVHGLWPQNNDGSYPHGCQTDKPGPTNPSAVADIMPAEIIEHEWKEHGTCSGLSGDDYFALIRKVYKSVHIPDGFRAPASSFSTSPQKLKSDFERVNSGLSDSNVVIQLNGNYLNAVEFCVAKGSQPSAASCSGVPDAHRGTFIVPPVR